MSDERRNAIQHELAALRAAARANDGLLDPDQLRQQAALHAERDALDAAAADALRARGPVVDPSRIAWQAEMDEHRRGERRQAHITAGTFILFATLPFLLAMSVIGRPASLVLASMGLTFGALRYAQARSRWAATGRRGDGDRWP